MSERWYVYKENGQTLGPLEPEEIRSALRDGSVDPFDLVAREGSSVRRELVDVDEIFASLDHGSPEVPPGEAFASLEPGELGSEPREVREPTRVGDSAAQGDAGGAASGAHEAPAPRKGRGEKDSKDKGRKKRRGRRRRDPSRFYLMDKSGRVLGPVSASDINARFLKGALSRSVHVLKEGSEKKIPVQRFCEIYSKTPSGKRQLRQAAHPAMPEAGSRAAGELEQGGRDRAPEKSQAAATRPAATDGYRSHVAQGRSGSPAPVAVGFFVLAVVLLLAALFAWRGEALWERVEDWVVWEEDSRRSERVDRREERRAALRRRLYEKRKRRLEQKAAERRQADRRLARERQKRLEQQRERRQEQLQAQIRKQRSRAEQARRAEERQRAIEEAQRARRELERRGRLREAAREAQKRRRAAQQASPPNPSKASGGQRSSSTQLSAKSRPKPKPKPKPKPRKRKRKSPSASSSSAPRRVGALKSGSKVAGLGPLRFDPSAVMSCSGPCNVTFKGLDRPITVSFFKQTWGEELLSTGGGPVRITGLVRKSGGSVTVVLQDLN